MQYFKIASLLAAAIASVQATNIVTLKSLDDVDRTVYFTPSAGHAEIAAVQVAAGQSVDVEIPFQWIGNWHGVQKGQANVPGMLGEVTFDGWGGKNYFDVSAIVNPNDKDNVSEMYPAGQPNTPTSGCKNFPCDNAYYVWDDVQTRVTTQSHLICTLHKNGYAKRDADEVSEEKLSRDFVLGKK
ncbi:uncharacterized protein E0L32_008084 [Thyridium curvatum]|uniref:DNase1 protein n=1 Tax=Thyridium curvatum TaxID=1093900 RepID=A0A507B1M3_9PEZI|nr:uncharacterized protein E0L32_008084 [Thyridium curvatum]TPX10878.1 hypothetical protein E0L32_008084 [Thyridium curvatum]